MNTNDTLELRNVSARYDLSVALSSVDLVVREGTSVALVGPNGAGKTTLLRVVMGLLAPISGEVLYNGAPINGVGVAARARQGIAYLSENRELFPRMTVLDNLCLGAVAAGHAPSPKRLRQQLDTVFDYFPRLRQRARQHAGTMSGGEQQMLAIGRILMGSPKLVLLDEPSLGLSPLLVKEIFKIIYRLKEDFNLTLVIAEQNSKLAVEGADFVYSLRLGTIKNLGSPKSYEEILPELELG